MLELSEPRRLPIYLLLDCSVSMAGAKMAGVNRGTQLLYQELMNDPRSADTVHISVITFSDQAYQMPLVPIDQFTPPKLEADNGGACLGAALDLLIKSLEHDIRPNLPGQKGDYKPRVFLLSDGHATDHWQSPAQRLKDMVKRRKVLAVSLAVGYDANLEVLKQITPTVVQLKDMSPSSLHQFFKFYDDDDIVLRDEESLTSSYPGARISVDRVPPLPGVILYSQPPPLAPSIPYIDFGSDAQQATKHAPPTVFVSHSHADDTFTYRLVGDLRAAGAEVWVDDATIRDGNFAKHISDGLDKSDYLVLVLTPHAISSDWVQEEVFTAITLVKQHRMRAVIPMLAVACDPQAMPSVWGSLHRYDATKDYPAALAGLLRALGLPGSSPGISIEL